MDSHSVSMWHWVVNGIGWWFSWSLGIEGDEYHSVVASTGISWTQRHRWTLTGWWHSLDGTVMSDDTHWVMIHMGDEYHLWWLTLGESNRFLAKDTDCCHSMNNANTHGWWPSLGGDHHWVMTLTGWWLPWMIKTIGHWSLILTEWRPSRVTMPCHGTCHGCRLTPMTATGWWDSPSGDTHWRMVLTVSWQPPSVDGYPDG